MTVATLWGKSHGKSHKAHVALFCLSPILFVHLGGWWWFNVMLYTTSMYRYLWPWATVSIKAFLGAMGGNTFQGRKVMCITKQTNLREGRQKHDGTKASGMRCKFPPVATLRTPEQCWWWEVNKEGVGQDMSWRGKSEISASRLSESHKKLKHTDPKNAWMMPVMGSKQQRYWSNVSQRGNQKYVW